MEPQDLLGAQLRDIVVAYVVLASVSLLLALAILTLVVRRLRRMDIPEDAGFLETLERVPLGLVLALDLLDLALDVFSTPISWAFLRYVRLHKLRQVTVVEALIPGTQLLPALTGSWLFVRFTRRHPVGRIVTGELERLAGDNPDPLDA